MSKRTISEKQRLANIANARKSTGPKTIFGKSISRRNAVKDGLSGEGVCLPQVVEGEIAAEIAIVAKKLKPNDPFEDRLVERMALASVRLNRIQAQREQDLQKRQREAVPFWDQGRADDVERLLGALDVDPAAAVRELTRFTEGCDALWDLWDHLKTEIEDNDIWTEERLNHALRLIGEPELPGPGANERAVRLAWMGLVLSPGPNVQALATLTGSDPLDVVEDMENMIAQANESIIPFIDNEMANLRIKGDHLWDTLDAPDRASAADRALIDFGPNGERLRRLEADANRTFDRSLATLLTVRREARLARDFTPIPKAEDTPAYRRPAQNEPISPVQEPEHFEEQRVASLGSGSTNPVQGVSYGSDSTPTQTEAIVEPIPPMNFPPRPAGWISLGGL
ncbi:MAG: hypothetical protein ABI353_12335 [Isosphaeraceae bacterium]